MLGISTSNLGNVVVLCLRGKIILGETVALRNAVACQIEASVIVLDLARVTAIDAHGLGVLLKLRGEAEANGIEFRLVNVHRLVRRILEITQLDSVFDIATERDDWSRTSGRGFSLPPGLAACA